MANKRPSSLNIKTKREANNIKRPRTSEIVEVDQKKSVSTSYNKSLERKQFDMYDLHYGGNFAQVTWFKDTARIHLRTRHNDRFSPNGIALIPEEWQAFETLWETINEEMESGGERNWRIGDRNVMVSVKKFGEFSYIDIRKSYEVASKRQYIRKGCTLSVKAFQMIQKCAPLINDDLDSLYVKQKQRDRERAENEKMVDERLARLASIKQANREEFYHSSDDELKSNC